MVYKVIKTTDGKHQGKKYSGDTTLDIVRAINLDLNSTFDVQQKTKTKLVVNDDHEMIVLKKIE